MTMEDNRGNVWAIVLAAGQGVRLSAFTQALHGKDMPKQFAAIYGDRSLLQNTFDRIAVLVPRRCTVVVVADDQRAMAQEQLAGYPGIEMVGQPMNRGTGAGMLLPLSHVLARDPEARVVILPSDHHVERETRFATAVRRAVAATEVAPSGVVLVGAPAESPAIDLGWILCAGYYGPTKAGVRRVESFVEKPPVAGALELLQHGALWNTLIVAARAQALWKLAERHVPEVCQSLTPYRARIGHRSAEGYLRDVYSRMMVTDLSRHILQRAEGLGVVSMLDAGWSDCGTPERLLRALGPHSSLAKRMAGSEWQATDSVPQPGESLTGSSGWT